ncbi:sodium/bile acid cotransporter 5 [Lingula anatina]|uniref:Sodium/bile acid cotransporter 5 n=1 Tax=Lingula anatina TaxID=7574 RepID=A0A1S3HUZ0_LINAN|nr:sodium/bile acid cotransporter 5 [Lingula anatina]XP_013389855.1 sodium/bile acid cotransporter 5 [Lingula anatina]XP_013389856.1 sodium/bile acid cotransporter 5 [Lingula anatina]XP_013389857.1 sodium/bile acid cotransporter 5 [Lingula anatina]XP_013389858.1 sodium/bile acid cotransporter 5 [Lingula anatina]XP_013389859.1 sodium/bile acid cotransporter 5 [Lingula anatina]|eukprot:XP_013389854.1 sodium/bile acid cotransporter 5 [Lingula anatina]
MKINFHSKMEIIVVVLALIAVISCTPPSSTTDPQERPAEDGSSEKTDTTAGLQFFPKDGIRILGLDEPHWIYYNISQGMIQQMVHQNATWTLHVESQNNEILQLISLFHDGIVHPADYLKFDINHKSGHSGAIGINAVKIGYTSLKLKIFNTSDEVHTGSNVTTRHGHETVMEYKVTIQRTRRTVDLGFDCAIAIVALFNSFGMGCVTKFQKLKDHIKHPQAVLLGSTCQFIIMPVLAFGLAKIFSMNDEMGLGLFYTACIPSGGFGYMLVMTIMDGERTLCLAMNCLSMLVVLVTAPLWMLALGQFFPKPAQSSDPLLNMEIWVAALLVPYASGLLLKQFRPEAAAAMLNWLIKPLLLLVTILFVTLGIYINHYMFDDIPVKPMVASALFPMSGFMLGGGIAFLAKQPKDNVKTIATETAISNCLIVIVSLRFSLDQPSADIASTVPFWVIIFTPATSVLLWFGRKVKHCLWNYCEKRINQQKIYEEEFTLKKGFESMANNTAFSTAAISMTSSPDNKKGKNATSNSETISKNNNDKCHDPLLDQHVTVL